jgi:23S rRNA pseudouridine955/2504/2580 synthase
VNNIIRPLGPQSPVQAKQIEVDEESGGQRLDNFLMRHLKGVPKTLIYRIIRSGEVRVNKGRACAESRVQGGDVIRIPPIRTSEQAQMKEEWAASGGIPAREFPVLMEDEHLMAIDKPAGVAVHGGSGVSFGVIEQLRQARPLLKSLELVHRIDRETSGILLVAKKRSALKHLQDQFRERETGKTYLAMVQGQWPSNRKVIDLPLKRFLISNGTQEGERRVRVAQKDDPSGLRAITLVRVARLVGGYSLLEVTIKTGRTHQIRVHLASLGYPILGDEKYGDFDQNKALQKNGLKRMFLHAWQLKFFHPNIAKPVTIECPLPRELQEFIDLQKGTGGSQGALSP